MNYTQQDPNGHDPEDRLQTIASHYGVMVTRRGIRIPCPVHQGRDPNLALWVAEKGYVRAYCHSEKCAFRDLAAAIGVVTGVNLYPASGSPNKRPLKDFEVCRYFHPDGKQRISYRKDYPRDFPAGPCTYRHKGKVECGSTEPHKHPWVNSGAKYLGVHPFVWGVDNGVVVLILVEGEKAARAVQDAGFIAVSLYGGAHHADKADYTMFAGRIVVVWPDRDNAGEGFAAEVSYQLGQAGVAELRFVGIDQQPKGDAADVDPDQREAILSDVLAGPPTSPAQTAPRLETSTAQRPDSWMFGDLAPGGDAARYLDVYDAITVVKRYEEQDGAHEATKTVAGILNTHNGLWTFDETTIDYKVMEQAQKEWERIRSELSPDPDAYTKRRLNYLGQITAHPGQARGRIPSMAGLPEKPDYAGVTFAHASQFDAPGQYIGCTNGVVDLRTGRLLLPDTGRKCLVTMSTGVEYRADATHELVDRLFAHVDGEITVFLLSAFGRALWGIPDNLFVLILGPTQAGKTTLLAAIGSALGAYFGSMDIDGLGQDGSKGNLKSAHTEITRAIFTKRVVSVPEAERGDVRASTLKALTDAAELNPTRPIFGKAEDQHPIGTMFISANAAPKLALADSAVRTRFRAVEYPEVPLAMRDPRVKTAFSAGARNKQAAEAMLALLVKYAVLYPPGTNLPVPPVVQAFTDAQINAAFTDFERWLQGRLTYVRGRRVSVNEVWKAWAEENDKDPGEEEIHGQKRDGLPAVIVRCSDAIPGLRPVTRARFSQAGKVEWGWIDYNLVTPGVEDVGHGLLMDLDGNGRCQECGKPLPPDPEGLPRTLCEDCAHKGWPDSGDVPEEEPAASQGSIDGALLVRIAAIDQEREAILACEPVSYTALANAGILLGALKALRSVAPDQLASRDLVELRGGAEGFVRLVEHFIPTTPGEVWKDFDWATMILDASARVQEQIESQRKDVLDYLQEWWPQRLLQKPLTLGPDGAPA